MMTLDLEALKRPVSDDGPCGVDLSGDAALFELETQIDRTWQPRGSKVRRDPDTWRPILATALELAQRSKDVRIYVILTRALTLTEGFFGLRDGLGLLRHALEEHLEDLQPAFEPSPRARLVYLEPLNKGGDTGLLADLATVPVVASRLFRVTAPHLKGEAVGDEGPLGPEQIDGAFEQAREDDRDALVARAVAAAAAADHLQAIEAICAGHRQGSEQPRAPKLDRLTEMLGGIVEAYRSRGFLRARDRDMNDEESKEASGNGVDPGDSGQQPSAGTGGGASDAATVGVSGGGAVPAAVGAITDRDGVLRAIDAMLAYYRRVEPSSPVPVLLKRARGLVTKDFVEAIEDLLPSGIDEIRKLGGLGTDDED